MFLVNLGGNRCWVPAADEYCKLETTFFARFLSGPLRNGAQFLSFFRSYLAPRLKVKDHNLESFQAHLYYNYIFTTIVKQLHLFANSLHEINYNHIIILSFPLLKIPSQYKKIILRLKSILFLRFAIHIFASYFLGITPSLCLERDVSSTPTCTGRCLGYISGCNGLPLQGMCDLCTQMMSYHALHLLKSLGT